MKSTLDSDAVEALRDFVRSLASMPKGFTVSGSFGEVCSVVIGFDVGGGRRFLDGFQHWLGQRRGRPQLAFWHHVAQEVSGDGSGVDALSDEESAAANQLLFRWLNDYLDEVG